MSFKSCVNFHVMLQWYHAKIYCTHNAFSLVPDHASIFSSKLSHKNAQFFKDFGAMNMFSLSHIESGLLFMPMIDVNMSKEVFYEISEKIKLKIYWPLNSLRWRIHFMIRTGVKQLQNVPTRKTVLFYRVILHILWNASTDISIFCVHHTVLNMSQYCLASTQVLATLITC